MPSRTRRIALPAVLFALALALPASASAAADIEAVWSFTGGQVAVRANPDGTFMGTVIRETTLATCPHAPGERMWVNVVAQPDGSYWGGHQWYRSLDCSPIPERGNTAYRVLLKPDGARFLRVCFAPPEQPEVQPTIAADGTPSVDNCDDSDLVSPLPTTTPKVDQIANLPKSSRGKGKRRCRSRRSFTIRLREPKGDALESATVFVNGKQVKTQKGERVTAKINLRGLPKGRYKVRLVAKTVLGRTIKGTRTYKTCAKKSGQGGGGPL